MGMELDKGTVSIGASSNATVDGALLLTYTQAAKRLSISRTTVYQLIAEGKLTPVHIGRSARITVAELDRFVSNLGFETANAAG